MTASPAAAPPAVFDFDTVVDRAGMWSYKWDRYAGRDVIPMWVADMDFRTAPVIVEALRAHVEHGIFGYIEPGAEVARAIVDRLARAWRWSVDPRWLVALPGLVSGLDIACRTAAEPGDEVITAVPVYPPFLSAPEHSGRVCVRVALDRGGDGVWRFDAARLEAAITPRTRLLLLCNPHNPVGRAWTQPELAALDAVCARHDLIVCSDEIHCGLVLDRHRTHVPYATLSEAAAERSITLMAASKTFNVPALGAAFAIVPDAVLRRRMQQVMAGIVHRPGGLGLVATCAAYRDGEPWRLALVDYLRGNRDLVARRVSAMPGLATTHVEATYLAWIDCRGAGIDDPAAFFEAAGVGLYDGAAFGAPGFVRLNFGCPRSRLTTALDRMDAALAAR
ncbi:MAG: PatB family C-S lyase [Burkholderiales bacterium]|jgi:cystathionine beta-lyase|nr:PatB family C-S lyase [Burkholderiales bacterium]